MAVNYRQSEIWNASRVEMSKFEFYKNYAHDEKN